VSYPALTNGASRFIDTLTPGILARYSRPHRRGAFIPGRLPRVPWGKPLLQYHDCGSHIPVERGVAGGARQLPVLQAQLKRFIWPKRAGEEVQGPWDRGYQGLGEMPGRRSTR